MRFKPQLANPVPKIPTGSDWVLEPKWDGWRILAERDEDGVRLWSRNGQPCEAVPAICKELESLPPGTVVDGEIVAFNSDGTQQWGAAQSALTSVSDTVLHYIVFDLLASGDVDCRSYPYAQRREALAKIFERMPNVLVGLCPQFTPDQATYDALVKTGFEGAVCKRKSAAYTSGKGHDWVKIKVELTYDVVVIGYEKGKSVGTLIFGQYDDAGNLVQRGRCKALKGLHENPDDLIARQQVIEVKCNAVMPPSKKNPHGALRHPQVLRVRADKLARECTI